MASENASVRGFYRVKIVNDDGTYAGDSGWKENLVTNDGFREYLVYNLGSIAGKKYVSHMGLGTGGDVVATDTLLTGEQSARQTVTQASIAGSKGVRFTATFNSGLSFVTATKSLNNIGLFDAGVTGVGTLFAGNTYASSSVAVNQAVNCTYDVTFV